jgi:2-polyprenyl-6-methoxyphenol hydroxylase-like FAD-dependent oxidoreductase
MVLKNTKAAIIGAGPVGLTMALLLQQKGIDVTVYERDKDAHTRIWGGTLDLHENDGQEALRKAGLLEGYFAMAKPMGRTITNEQGKVLFSVKPNYETPEINRNDLRQLLLDRLTDETVVWDRRFTGLEEHDGKWLLHFENETTATADFVIGANGGMSNARKYVTAAEAEHTGTIIIQGEVHRPAISCADFYQLCGNSILMTACNGINVVANPDNNGALTYNVTFRGGGEYATADENGLNFQNPESIRAFLLNKLSAWHGCYKQLLLATSFFAGLPTRKIALDTPWKSNRPLPITLIGDAAHIMPPFAGRGVNTGLMDALILSSNLTDGKFETIEAAISDYEQKMIAYAAEAQLETGRNEIEMHQTGFSFQKRFSI